jgi:hypothetical protein
MSTAPLIRPRCEPAPWRCSARREYARAELSTALQSQGLTPPTSLPRRWSELAGEGLLNDERYAESLVRQLVGAGAGARCASGRHLHEAGIPGDLIATVIEAGADWRRPGYRHPGAPFRRRARRLARAGPPATPWSPPVRWCPATTRRCCSPMPAWCSSRTCSSARIRAATCARRPCSAACAPAASTTTWRTWATRPGITPSSRCSATFQLRRLLQARRDPLRLGVHHRHAGARPSACGSPSTATTTRPPTSG